MLINPIHTSKNLLAFSGGVDSTSLFFILLEHNIPFDIVIVDYNQRIQSKDEIKYAHELAKKYNKNIFVKSYDKEKFSEKIARDFRYEYFDYVMELNAYETLFTAHQLNDKLEWLLMQFTKGAGLVELIGLEEYSPRNNYTICRPLLRYSKKQLLEYLETNNIKYFLDETNKDPKYTRNYFRQNFSNGLMEEYEDGIRQSFEYLQKDIDSFEDLYSVKRYEELCVAIFKVDDINVKMRFIDKEIKKRGILLSKNTKDEIFKQKELVISHTLSICIESHKVFIAPFIQIPMEKSFKEWCRINGIAKNIRAYLFTLNHSILKEFLI